MRIAMSWRRLLCRLGSLAISSSFSYELVLSQYTAPSPRSWARSSLRLSEALQKCARPCCNRWGGAGLTADLNICSFASVGMRFLSLIITPTCWPNFLVVSCMCLLNWFSLWSIKTSLLGVWDSLFHLGFLELHRYCGVIGHPPVMVMA